MCLAACGGDKDPTGPQAAEIQLNLTEITLDQQQSVQVVPSVVDAKGTLLSGVPVTFGSANPAIVTVSNIGVVTSVGPAGNTTVQVKAAGLVRTLPVTVRGVATKLVVDPNPGTIPQKGTLQLVARLLDRVDTPIPNATFTFESAAPTIATVSGSGLVTSVGPSGIVSITVRSGDFAAVVQVAVTQVPTRIDAAPSPATVTVNQTRQLQARLLDAVDVEIKGAAFTYTSSAPNLVTVSANGTITSVGPLGNAKITVRAAGTSLAIDVPVSVITAGHPDGTVTSVPVAGGSYAVAIVSADEGYASIYGGVVSRLDLVARTATQIPDSHGGLALAASPSRREVYSAWYQSGGIDVISVSGTPRVVATIATPIMALDMVVSPDERTLYASLDNGTVAVIDLATRSVTTISLGLNFLHLAVHPTKPLLYGTPGWEIDVSSRAARKVVPTLPIAAQAIAVTSDGGMLYVANEGGTVEEFNLTTGQRSRTFTTCDAWGMRMSPDDNQLFVACSVGNAVIIDRQSGAAVKTIPGGGSRRVTISADGRLVLIGAASGGVTVIR